MATGPYDDILKSFDGLSREQRLELLAELERRQVSGQNGHAAGRTLLDAFKDHDMVGSISDAPEDWSSNPTYMEGLGSDGE